MSVRVILALVLLPALVAPAEAQYANKWGAVAYGGNGQTSGTAVNYPSAAVAREAALESCGGRCTRTLAFLRTCAAVAETRAGETGWAINRWRDRAIARSLALCARRGPGCALTAWACTAH